MVLIAVQSPAAVLVNPLAQAVAEQTPPIHATAPGTPPAIKQTLLIRPQLLTCRSAVSRRERWRRRRTNIGSNRSTVLERSIENEESVARRSADTGGADSDTSICVSRRTTNSRCSAISYLKTKDEKSELRSKFEDGSGKEERTDIGLKIDDGAGVVDEGVTGVASRDGTFRVET